MESEVWFAIRQNLSHIKYLDVQIVEAELTLEISLNHMNTL